MEVLSDAGDFHKVAGEAYELGKIKVKFLIEVEKTGERQGNIVFAEFKIKHGLWFTLVVQIADFKKEAIKWPRLKIKISGRGLFLELILLFFYL